MFFLSYGLAGIDATPITVTAARGGAPGLAITGLTDVQRRESRIRILAALRNSGLDVPAGASLAFAPVDQRKDAAPLDLPAALALVLGLGDSDRLAGYAAIGELALDGTVRRVRGVFAAVEATARAGLRGIIVPADNAAEAVAALNGAPGLRVVPVASLRDAMELRAAEHCAEPESPPADATGYGYDCNEVHGNRAAVLALAAGAALGQNVLLVGPPGAGKSMIARRAVTFMAPLAAEERRTLARIYSAAGLLDGAGPALPGRRPFRAPHYTISDAGLVGGGSLPRPGEITLAHHGVLFLDELPEFRRPVLELLCDVARLGTASARFGALPATVTFPARPAMIVGAMNPCPCGWSWRGSEAPAAAARECVCRPDDVARYLARIAPTVRRLFPIVVRVDPARAADLVAGTARGIASADLARGVVAASDRARSYTDPADRLAAALSALNDCETATPLHRLDAAALAPAAHGF